MTQCAECEWMKMMESPGSLPSATSFNLSVTPKFEKDADNDKKVQFEMKCMLKSEKSWITPAPFTLIAANGRHFEIRVDPLSIGLSLKWSFYQEFASILCTDSRCHCGAEMKGDGKGNGVISLCLMD